MCGVPQTLESLTQYAGLALGPSLTALREDIVVLQGFGGRCLPESTQRGQSGGELYMFRPGTHLAGATLLSVGCGRWPVEFYLGDEPMGLPVDSHLIRLRLT